MTVVTAPLAPETAYTICSSDAITTTTAKEQKIVLDLTETEAVSLQRMRQLSVGSHATAALTLDDDDENSLRDTLCDYEEDPAKDTTASEEKENAHKQKTHTIEMDPDFCTDSTRSTRNEPPSRIGSTTSIAVTTNRRPSIKRYNPAEIPIEEKKSSWKNLPRPDLGVIRAQTAPAVLVADEELRQDMKIGVRFHQVVIREYEQTVGDNPSVSYGPPISLDWEYFQLPELDLDLYESHRGKRRGMRQMMMNYYQRRNLLSWRYGITEEQLKQAEKDANKIKRARSFTKALLPAQKLEEMVQSVSRKSKRMANKNKRVMDEVSA